jgi:hypothetical protein
MAAVGDESNLLLLPTALLPAIDNERNNGRRSTVTPRVFISKTITTPCYLAAPRLLSFHGSRATAAPPPHVSAMAHEEEEEEEDAHC